MVLEGETILAGGPDTCPDCGSKLELKVCRSQAGYYIGTECECGPYSRESGYFSSAEKANAALKEWRQIPWRSSAQAFQALMRRGTRRNNTG